jgi:hypothetical protein
MKISEVCDVSIDYLVGLKDEVEVRQLSPKEKIQLVTETLTRDPSNVQDIFERVVLPQKKESHPETKTPPPNKEKINKVVRVPVTDKTLQAVKEKLTGISYQLWIGLGLLAAIMGGVIAK